MTVHKKDLMNTYIVNDKGGLLYLYMTTCNSVGFHKFGKFDQDFYKKHKYVVCNEYSEPSEEGILQGHYSVDNSLRELSWDDLLEMQLCSEDAVKEDVEETTEWDGEGLPPVGTKCEVSSIESDHKNYSEFTILKYGSGHVWMEYVGELKCRMVTIREVNKLKFRKPETPLQKEERKRLETVKDMFSYWSEDEGDFVAGDESDRWVVSLLFALYDAGYKKEG